MQIRKKLGTTAAAIAAAIALAGLAAPAALAAPAPHVHPALSGPLCESSSPFLCADDGGPGGNGQWVTDHGEVSVIWQPNGNTFTWAGVVYNVGTLAVANQGVCIGGGGLDMFDESCSTGAGTIWGKGSDGNGHTIWVNRLHTQNNGTLTVLAGTASVGAVVTVQTWPPASGVYERWQNFT